MGFNLLSWARIKFAKYTLRKRYGLYKSNELELNITLLWVDVFICIYFLSLFFVEYMN